MSLNALYIAELSELQLKSVTMRILIFALFVACGKTEPRIKDLNIFILIFVLRCVHLS